MKTYSFFQLARDYRESIEGMFRAMRAGRATDAGTYARDAVRAGRALAKREGGHAEIWRMMGDARRHTPTK